MRTKSGEKIRDGREIFIYASRTLKKLPSNCCVSKATSCNYTRMENRVFQNLFLFIFLKTFVIKMSFIYLLLI